MGSDQLTRPPSTAPPKPVRFRRMIFGVATIVLLVLLGVPIVASYTIEFQWWREMKQVPTWIEIMMYSVAPLTVATLLCFGILSAAHQRGMKFAGMRLQDHAGYAKLSVAVLL